jgi:hypothetical protein
MSTTLKHFSLVNQVGIVPENTLMLVGTALDGPANIPFELRHNIDPYEALGFSPLAHAYAAARRAGATRILAYRVNGTYSNALLKDRNGEVFASFQSVSASNIYNNIQMILYPDYLYLVSTDGTTRSYFFDKYPTVGDLTYAINKDAYYGIIEFNAENVNEYAVLTNLVDGPTSITFTGGQIESHLIHSRNPLNQDFKDVNDVTPLLKEKLKKALFGEDPTDILERQPNSDLGILGYGVLALCDMFHDDDPEYTEMLGSFCLHKTKEIGSGCIGVIGTQPIYPDNNLLPVNFDSIVHQRMADLVSLTESLEDNESYKYVQVIVGHANYPQAGIESMSLAYGFAATQSSLPYYTMMSNKSINGVSKLNYEISKEDVALLSANGYTCIVPSIRRGFVPYYSTSYSKDKLSPTARPHNIRISQHITSAISQEVDSLIGSEYTTLSVSTAIDKAKSILADMQTQSVIRDYDIAYSLSDSNTSLDIEVSFTPVSEVTAISSITTLTFPREVTE